MGRRTRFSAVWMLAGLGLAGALFVGAVVVLSKTQAFQSSDLAGPGEYWLLAADKSLGINTDLSQYDPDAREAVLSDIKAAGFQWLRQRFPWDAIEPQQGVLDWEVWDEIVGATSRHNLGLIAVLDGSPNWARDDVDRDNPLAPPAEREDYGAFVSAFAERYGSDIDYYQIWDEPNIAPHWGSRQIDPAEYANLLREASIQVRTADSGAVILAGALAPNVEGGGANMSDLLFLDALYQQGAAEWFDVVAAQTYGFDKPFGTAPDPEELNWRRPELLHSVMAAYEGEQKPVWLVSFGVKEEADEGIGPALEVARSSWPWLGPMVWAAWSPTDLHGQYALTDGIGEPQSAFYELRDWMPAAEIGWPGSYPPDHSSGRYAGTWRVSPFGVDIGQSGDILRIPFRGTRLDLEVRRGSYRAFLYVTVDGQPANALPQDGEGRAFVSLYDPLLAIDSVTLASGLDDNEHIAEIEADRGWGQWAILGWTVTREAGAPSWLTSLAVVLGTAAVLVLGVTLFALWQDRGRWDGFLTSVVARYRSLDDRLVLVLVGGLVLLVYVVVGTVPSLVVLGLLALALLPRPEMGLPIIALALPFYQLGKPLLGRVFSMVEILTMLTALAWLINQATTMLDQGVSIEPSGTSIRRAISRATILDWGVIVLVVLGAASLLWSEHTRVAARELRTVILGSALYYGLLRSLVQGRRGQWLVADAWVLGGALAAGVGIMQWVLGEGVITAEGVSRVRGFYGSPNNLALYLGRLLPLGVAIGVWGQGGRRRWMYGLAAVMMGAAIALTFSRGAWVLGVPAALLFLAVMRGRRAFALTAATILVVAVVGSLVVGPGRLTSMLDTEAGTTFFRLQLWRSSLEMIQDHPLLGVGLDNFLYHYRTHYVMPAAWQEFNLSHPHNFVLDFWLRLGLLGVGAIVWLVLGFFRRGLVAYRYMPGGDERLLALGLMGGMVAFVAHGLVDNAYFLVDLAFAFMLMLALVQAPSPTMPQDTAVA